MGTLERVINTSTQMPGGERHIVFQNIAPDLVSAGICYVRGGEHRFTKADKPYIRLFLQDITGAVIPGYIFDVGNFKQSGLELTQVIHQIVKVDYRENYLPRYGMSIIIDKLHLVVDAPMSMLEKYVGSVQDIQDKYQLLQSKLKEVLKMPVSIPFTICNASHMDYSQGKIGGLVIHYWDMYEVLSIYARKFSEEEQHILWGMFTLFIFVHSNYLRAEAEGCADINLVTQLTAKMQRHQSVLKVSDGVLELVHIFFGYKPKDVFVRLVVQVSDNLIQMSKEVNLYQSLPISREGDAGYGTIRRYELPKE